MSESLHSFWHGQDPFAIHEYVNNELNSRLLYRLTPGRRKGAVIVCAGGAYIWKSPREDWPVADAYARAGYQTYVLDYTADMQDAPLGTLPLRQLAWAMRIVRENNIQEGRPDFIAVAGFSAGGHLCASLGVHWNDPDLFKTEEQRRIRPDAMILGYAVTDLHAFDGKDLVKCLCGDSSELYEYFSVRKYVTKDTPPAFLWHTVQDEEVPVQSSLDFAQTLIEHHVPTELHIFPKGPHGMSLATADLDDPDKGRLSDSHVALWFELSVQWLEEIKMQSRCNKVSF
jgi:acetyl esterase/lipase